MMSQLQRHWEDIFRHKTDEQKSWFQPYPSISISFIDELHLPEDATIIDVGGGDSRVADTLLEKGYKNITILDISDTAIANTKKRLGQNASKIKWVVSDILDYHSNVQF